MTVGRIFITNLVLKLGVLLIINLTTFDGIDPSESHGHFDY